MKIAVTSSGTTLDDNVEPRFGRCPYFLVIDLNTMALEAMANPNISLGGGAGPQSALLMAEQGVSAVLTGNCGPNAIQTFGATGIQVITGVSGTVREAVGQYKSGSLVPSTTPSVESHFGMGAGQGIGRGCGGGMGGGGRKMGGGLRRSAGMRPAMTASVASPSDASQGPTPQIGEDIDELKKAADRLRGQLEKIEQRLAALDNKS